MGTTSALSDRISILRNNTYPLIQLATQVIINCRGGGSCNGGHICCTFTIVCDMKAFETETVIM